MPLNAFGAALQEAGFNWTQALCEADSDGDGMTNGEELGDPCCLWRAHDVASQYTAAFTPSHPGDPSSKISGYSRPDCSITAPQARTPDFGHFNEGEEQRYVDLLLDKFEIPDSDTTYADFAWNFPDESHGTFHIVAAEAIVDQKEHLHHYVVRGCPNRFPEEKHGKQLGRRDGFSAGCGGIWGTWAPGRPVIANPPWGGRPLGRDAGVVAFTVQVHFDNPNRVKGRVSQDGMRIYYTPNLRPVDFHWFSTMQLSSNLVVGVPPGLSRHFITRSCKLSVTDRQTRGPAEIHVAQLWYHAHLLGREMYAEYRQGGNKAAVDIGSDQVWHFDDQYIRNMLPMNLTLRTGDHLQTTCVYDTTGRTELTSIDEETNDEMCWATFEFWPAGVDVTCQGELWDGELQVGESASGIETLHPMSEANFVLDGEDLLSGGNVIRGVPKCADNPKMMQGDGWMTCSNIATFAQMRSEMNCDSKMMGATLLSVCCTELCESMCPEHEDCPKTASGTHSSSTSKFAPSTSAATETASRTHSSSTSTFAPSLSAAPAPNLSALALLAGFRLLA